MSESKHRGRFRAHKDLQLCRQVADAIQWFLADVDDPVLAELSLVAAAPAPTAARIAVTLAVRDGVEVDVVRAALAAYADELREEVAAEIHRRRVPELAFRVATTAELAAAEPPT